MSNIFVSFPDQHTLLRMFSEVKTLGINGHIHTPYSFSAFKDIPQIFELARLENISIVGINDFFVTDGYGPFYKEALKKGIFPLFNIEFIGLMKAEQQNHIRINDPNNPGRCYFSGKGLDYPFSIDDRLGRKLKSIVGQSQLQIRAMIDKINTWFRHLRTGIILEYEDIRKRLAKELVRERHIAKAIRIAVFTKYRTDAERNTLLTLIFDGRPPKSELTDNPGLENEIRGNLLKAGGKGFVAEDDNAFMSIDEIMEIIVSAGGIPCYPVLLDDKDGNYTEYEKDQVILLHEMKKRNIGCIELIPGRNEASRLERFITYFHDEGFVVILGTEHNTPDMIPITCDTRGNLPLSGAMKEISYKGACVVAAHQYLHARGQSGFIDSKGTPQLGARESFIRLGNAVIHHFIQSYKRNH